MIDILLDSSIDTIYMVFVSMLLATILGGPIAIILYLTRKDGLRENKVLYNIFDFIVNIFRSVPFIILMILLIPVTRLIVGKSIGTTASIVPLTIASAPFVARVFEASFLKIDKGRIDAARSMGSSISQIIFKVLIPESLPYLVNDITITLINLVGYSAMAGSIGGGGLGNMAIKYGLYNFQFNYLIIAVIAIVILVQLIQFVGNRISNIINKD